MDLYEQISALVESQAKVLVGTLLKRVEVLDQEQALSPSLFKAIAREHIYENARALNQLIKMRFEIGKVVFTSKK